MCLGIPGQIIEFIDEENHIAKVEVSGVRRNVNVALVRPDGFLRLGVADRRGGVFEFGVPEGSLRLAVPAALAR